MPPVAAELAVGDALQADVLLPAHGFRDRAVLDGRQLVGLEFTGLELAPRPASSAGRSRLPTWSARKGAFMNKSFRVVSACAPE